MNATRTTSITARIGRRRRLGATLLVLFSLLVAPAAHPLELGPLNVHSTLGERLRAEVGIVSVGAGGLAGVRASLADVATYERFGVPRPDVLSSVAVSVAESEGGAPIVRIGSTEPVHELFLNVLLRIEDRDIRLVREVAILLDPSVTPSTRGGGQAATEGDAYVVRAGDSLMRIAARFAPSGASAEQTAVALYEAHPEAFLGSIHRLIVGARLRAPAAGEALAHSPRAARAFIRTGIEDFKRRLSITNPRAGGEAGETETRPGDTTAPADLPEDGLAAGAGSVADATVLPLEDDLALQDFQAVIVNLKGSLYELQGTLDERIDRLDGLHARVDELIGERVKIREAAERDAMAAEVAAQAAERVAEAAADALAVKARPDPVPAAAAPEAPAAGAPPRPARLDSVDAEPGAESAGERSVSGAGAGRRITEASRERGGESIVPVERNGALPPDASRPAFEPAGDSTPVAAEGASGTSPEDRDRASPRTGITATTRDEDGRAGVPDGGDRSVDDGMSEGATAPANVGGSTDLPIRHEAANGLPRSRWSLEQMMQALRDGGLIVLALCMIHVLFSRRFRQSGDANVPDFDPEAAVDFYLRQSADERMNTDLLEAVLVDSPERQDVRLQLLERYAQDGSMTRFAAEAQAMYRMTRGGVPEWHRVVELGLELDAGIDFYRMVIDEDPFDLELNLGLSDSDRVASVPGGTHVGGDGHGGHLQPVVSFEEFAALRNSVARRDAEERLSEAPELHLATDANARAPSVAARDDTLREPVPLERRPVYVPEDAAELIAIAVNYTYGVEKLDVDLSKGDAAAFPPTVELAADGVDEHVPDEPAALDDGIFDAPARVDESIVRHDDFFAEFVDFDASPDSGDLMIDLEFSTDSVDLKLSLAETYVDNDCHAEARKLIDEALPRADVAQRRLADELLERIARSPVPRHALG